MDQIPAAVVYAANWHDIPGARIRIGKNRLFIPTDQLRDVVDQIHDLADQLEQNTVAP